MPFLYHGMDYDTNHIRRRCNLCCEILEARVSLPIFVTIFCVMNHSTKRIASVRLAQARPNNAYFASQQHKVCVKMPLIQN